MGKSERDGEGEDEWEMKPEGAAVAEWHMHAGVGTFQKREVSSDRYDVRNTISPRWHCTSTLQPS